ncbi:MAG: hypothetical protein KatS3mg081_0850 [Gemmatimonadales bacterium]|nr:MAG: hypothetical protein KatS3mg081_0850 [Gemmatimonadales bacterium]
MAHCPVLCCLPQETFDLIERTLTKENLQAVHTTLAAGSNFPIWRIQRVCRKPGLPPPQRLVEWLTLIHAIAGNLRHEVGEDASWSLTVLYLQ